TKDSTATASMVPSRLTVPAGTTVTFTNPSDAAFGVAGSGNLKEHCATQYFEGKFNFRLQPGQSAQYTFDREGEYYYNDCTDPRPVGKVIATLAPQAAPLQIEPSVLQLKSGTGVFQAILTVPEGWQLDSGPVGDPTIGPVTITTPLTTQTFNAVRTVSTDGTRLVATFNRGDIDNNVPEGNAVPLIVSANFLDSSGVQRKLQ